MTPEDAPSRPDLVTELRLRVPLPLIVPVVAVTLIFLCTFGFSRILLAISAEAATTIAIVMAANILIAGAFVSLRRRMHRVEVLEVALIALYPIVIGVLLAYTGFGAEPEAAAGEQQEQAAPQEQQAVTSGDAITLVAEGVAFNTEEIQIPGGEQVSVTLDNQDTVAHDFAIYANEQDGQAQRNALFEGEQVDPGSSTTYDFRAPRRDAYFQCNLHPTMNGDVVVS